MKPCPECGNNDYTYYQEDNKYFLGCTSCGYYAEEEWIKKLEGAEELVVDSETEDIKKNP
jgi:Zn ribbon nucleic-acid-binding protein